MEPSRIGREQAETGYVLKRLADAGIDVWYYLEDRRAELDTAVGKFMEGVHAFGAELEREKIRQRTGDGMLERARAGLCTGGAVYGYASRAVYESGRKDAHGQSIPDYVDRRIVPEEARVVEGIFKMYVAWIWPHGYREVPERVPGPGSGVGRVLRGREAAPPPATGRAPGRGRPCVRSYGARAISAR